MRSILLALPTVPLVSVALLLASCGDNDAPPMVGEGIVDEGRAEALYNKAQQADSAGKKKKAAKLYDELAEEMPLAAKAPDARFRQAQLLEELGEVTKSFDAYQDFLTRYQGSGLYQTALDRQARMAFGAADGDIRNSFLGLKSNYSTSKTVGMLQKVASNAPRSPVAAEAGFKIGELYESEGTEAKAIPAYRAVVDEYPDSSYAPEAQFKIGEILVKEANEGNQDQANLYRAREAFQDYLDQYPGHKRNAEARKLMSTLGARDIERSFEIAEFYADKGNTSSARFYYQEVVRKTGSGELHDRAKARLAALGE